MNDYLDHLLWACDDLDRGCRRFTDLTGVEPRFGGVHASGLTQNALVAVGSRCYLEILAPVHGPRPDDDDWTRAARAAKEGQILTYCLRSPRPLAQLANAAAAQGWKNSVVASNGRVRPDGVSLKWEWLAPVVEPFGRAFPFFIDWLDSPHPADSAAAAQPRDAVSLRRFSVGHPRAPELAQALSVCEVSIDTFESPQSGFRVDLETPRGRVSL